MAYNTPQEALRTPDSDLHKQMLKECLDLVKTSRQQMCQYYSQWDMYWETYKGERKRDEQDKKAAERKEPEKMIIPMTYAQVQTFVAFIFQQFDQRERFFELTGTGAEDWKAAKIAEALLDRDLTHNTFVVKLYQYLLNIGVMGLGVMKASWSKESQKRWVKEEVPSVNGLSGLPMFGTTQMVLKDMTKFLGNKLDIVSPYRWFPDPNVPIDRFQDGEFCASELDVTHNFLRRMEKAGTYFNTKGVPDISTKDWEGRMRDSMRSQVQFDKVSCKQKGGVVLTEIIREIIPNEYKVNDKPLGEEDYPVKYVISIANESRVIQCQPANYLHDEYNYVASQLSPEQHSSLSGGVAELINELQSVITWLFNSRISSVRRTIHNQLVVDPEGVEMSDIAERRSVIRLKKGVARSGVDRWVKQLPVTDVTSSHITDAQALGTIMQLITGINENALGQYSTGRRSAEQTKAVNAGAFSRLKMYSSLIWAQGMRPLGQQMLSNLRDGLDEEQIVRVMGLQTLQPQSPYAVSARDFQQFLGVTKSDLVGNYDFLIMDGTLPTEKSLIAGQLQELLMGIMSNPTAAAILGLDAKALLTEIAELSNIRNPERFFIQPTQQAALLQAAQQTGQPQLGMPAGSAAITSQTAGLPPDMAAIMGDTQLPSLPM